MSPQEWKKIKEIFDVAVELSAAERAAFLEQRCDDREVRGEVEKMLAADTDQALETPIVNLPKALGLENGKSIIGETVGNYRILREIGRGGMGAVYLATHEDFKNQVALKIVQNSLNNAELLRRFNQERQILANLEHPNIARFLDGGTTRDGLSFFVMEYVEGEDIITFCENSGLSINERLALFRKVCAAVGYAHSRLVVHRDLKPSNILVTENGEPKLLDFGISKLLSSETEKTATVTQLGLMTPAYASPEQLRSETIATASDIYSLGVVLYELLTNRLPYELKSRRIDEIARAVCETEPIRPSSLVINPLPKQNSTSPNGQRTKDKEQRTNSKFKTQNSKLLKGDLDNIVLKALKKEPERRYKTVEQFSEDIRRHLNGLPILARPDTFGYRASKFVKRNRVAVVSAALIALVLLGGVTATVYQAIRAERERSLAQKRFEQARKVANSLVYKYSDAVAKLPESSEVRQMLLKDASDYLDELAQDAKGDLALQRELGQSYMKLADIQGAPHGTSIGDTAGAIETYEKAIALFESIFAAAPKNEREKDAEWLISAYSQTILTLARASENREKREFYRDRRTGLVEDVLREFPDNFRFRLEMARAEMRKGNLLFKANFAEGERFYEERILPVVAEIERNPALYSELETLADNVYNNLGWRYSSHGNLLLELGENREEASRAFQKSLDYYTRYLKIQERQLERAPQSPYSKRSVAVGLTNVGLALRDLERYDESFAYQKRSLDIWEEYARFDSKNLQGVFDLGVNYAEYGATFAKKKDFAPALDYLNKSLGYFERVIAADPKHYEAVYYKTDVLVYLGNAHAEMGNREKALEYFEKAGDFRKEFLTEETNDQVQYGRIYFHTGRAFIRFAEKEKSKPRADELWRNAQARLETGREIIQKISTDEKQLHLRVFDKQLEKCAGALAPQS